MSTSELRNDLFNIAKTITSTNDIVRVTHKSGDYVLLSADMFDSIEETLFLDSNPNFSKSIDKASKEIKNAETVSLSELKKMYDL